MGMNMGMMPMMCRMSMEMTKDGMTMKCMPMDAAAMDAFKDRCEAMMHMAMSGVPMMMTCGGMTMMCMPAMTK